MRNFAGRVRQRLEDKGVNVQTGAKVEALEGDEHVRAVCAGGRHQSACGRCVDQHRGQTGRVTGGGGGIADYRKRFDMGG